ncbi:hypothetical protein [Streptomyces sp. NPDC016675]|uniref:hypothetical protein n=1 Tax=Streptomyces sp. NPDC016675 TaxID=3364970 RepID=UPI0036FCD09E
MSGQWEYQFVTLVASPGWDERVNSMLADWGAQGWEPVNHTSMADRDGYPSYFSFLFRRILV